ncbi:MSHA biogenesis protein MshP [Vibrio europaeus]|uniref:MSHA biogenesis protein MshP n=1 Tax=Vibrio europaeus TaxID=300876 RepID=A0AAE7AXW0_9VIBR|nr:MSHA biogenesis protein MshP [Vibrio europaeus]MDC5804237.1 MSHA biogenesis protein MshP [Vibrio europaeus]MDC5808961.1 MSHA biogenesis protein MshP [Vibrio europaeus]MDC5823860.1 MSHA biogenesis protein MshP [Vibrio europaeus]MDC5829015.1 MSHA biogenesis protein MshP [Vibrio europaeus]MDC5836555.1 MSHA biogenesis protein MshP [Vibrio europaeus]
MSRSKQQGSLYIVIIFVLVVMGFLATTLSQIGWSNSDSYTKDVVGTQAAFLAHSGNEWALEQIYGIERTNPVSTQCATINGSNIGTFQTTINCQNVQVSCDSRGGQLADGTQMYVISSTAICGTGINQMQRNQEVWIRE